MSPLVALRWEDLDDQDDEDEWWAALAAEPLAGSWLGILEQVDAARPRWQKRAACAGLGPEVFYPQQGDPGTAARAVCARCEVSGPCGAFAINEQHGVWAGRGPLERRAQRRAGRVRTAT